MKIILEKKKILIIFVLIILAVGILGTLPQIFFSHHSSALISSLVSDETYEQMLARMHPNQLGSTGGSSDMLSHHSGSSSGAGMVGGC